MDQETQLLIHLAKLEAAINGAHALLQESRHSKLNLVGEGLLHTFYEFTDLLNLSTT